MPFRWPRRRNWSATTDRHRPPSQRELTLDLFDASATFSVGELCSALRSHLQALPVAWVNGEVQRVRRSRRGHLYCELVEKGEDDQIIAKLEAVIWNRDLRRIDKALAVAGQPLEEGLQIRCLGQPDFYAPFGRLQLVVREVDGLFTLGVLAQRRQQTIASLQREGLLELNRSLPLPRLPLAIALITSEGSAAYHDFLSTLRESGYGFHVDFLHAAVQGRDAETEIATALARASRTVARCVVLIRGGGARTDLAAFDSVVVAEAIARCSKPVITGLGHEIDRTIADMVAHTATKTPTQAAQMLVGCLQEAEAELARVGDLIAGKAFRPQTFAKQRLAAARSALVAAGSYALALRRRRLKEMAGTLRREAPQQLRRAAGDVESYRRLCRELAPERVLHRGFSITRDVRGKVVRKPEAVAAGDRLTTQLEGGTVASVVEEA